MISVDMLHQHQQNHIPPVDVEDDASQSDEDENEDDNEDDIDLGDEDQDEYNGCLRFYVDLKDQGPIISWSALCASLDEDSEEGAATDAMDVDDADESVSQGSYYDVNDPFIDDSELFDVEQSKRIETEMKGFFVQTGDIAVVEKKPKPKSSRPKSKPAIRPATPEFDEYADKIKVIIGGQVDEVLTDEMTSLRDLINANQEKLSDSDKKPMPVALETALMNFEERIRTIKATERKHVYAQLSGLFPPGSFLSKGNIKEKLKKLYTQWLPKKFDAQSKKVIRRLKQKIKKDVAAYEAAVQSGDTSAACVSVSKKSDGKLKYRCRWDLFAPDLLELSTIARDFTAASNAAIQQKSGAKSKPLDNVPSVELLQEDAVRRRYFKQVLESWPSDCAVTSIHLNDAYKRYKIKNENTGAGAATFKDSPSRRASTGAPTNANSSCAVPAETTPLPNEQIPSPTVALPAPTFPAPVSFPIKPNTPNPISPTQSAPVRGTVFDSPPPSPFAGHLWRRHPSENKPIEIIDLD